jgi:hypothetical protein
MGKEYDLTGLRKFADQHYKGRPVIFGLGNGSKRKNFLPYTGRK